MIALRVLQAFPVIIYAGSLFLYITSGKKLPLIFILGLFFLDTLTNSQIKKFFEKYFKHVKLFVRPNPPDEGCGLFPDPTLPGAKSF